MSWQGGPGAGATVVAEPPVMLVRYRTGVIGQTARTVHLVPMPHQSEAAVLGALCGALVSLAAIETVAAGEGVPCAACVVNHVSATAPIAEPAENDGTGPLDGGSYEAWGWPVTQQHGQVSLSLRCAVSAIAIPAPLSVEVTQILYDRHCAPAVLAHPEATEHHIVLAGEQFATALPWPPSVYRVTGALMLPPTMTLSGPITWVVPPKKDSLQLTREIDVFGALRTALSGPGQVSSSSAPALRR